MPNRGKTRRDVKGLSETCERTSSPQTRDFPGCYWEEVGFVCMCADPPKTQEPAIPLI